MKTAIVISLAVIAGAAGDVLLKAGMGQVGKIDTLHPIELFHKGFTMFTTPLVLAAIVSLAIYFFLFSAALSWAPVSFVVPLTAFSYVLIAIFGRLLLGEDVSPTRWAGILFICLGVGLVGRTLK